ADLEPFALDGLHEVQVLAALHLAQHDIADPDPGVVHRRHGANLARRDAPRHGSAARAELNRFPPLQALDVAIPPAHRSSSPLGPLVAPEGRRVEPRRQAEARDERSLAPRLPCYACAGAPVGAWRMRKLIGVILIGLLVQACSLTRRSDAESALFTALFDV